MADGLSYRVEDTGLATQRGTIPMLSQLARPLTRYCGMSSTLAQAVLLLFPYEEGRGCHGRGGDNRRGGISRKRIGETDWGKLRNLILLIGVGG